MTRGRGRDPTLHCPPAERTTAVLNCPLVGLIRATWRLAVVLLLAGALSACGRNPGLNWAAGSEPVDRNCIWPSIPDTLVHENGTIQLLWSFPLEAIHTRHVLPNDPDLLTYRTVVREAGAAVPYPRLVLPEAIAPDGEEVWRDETHNNRLAYSGAVGTIEPLTCLDALLFAEQNRRISQIERPTEFLASVLVSERDWVTVVFGAGDEMFLPSSVYGFDIVDEYVADGWRYWYALHNHTLQSSGDDIVLGVPVPSTSDVSLARILAEERRLESLRVTNGFYTFSARIEDLSEFRGR